MTAAMAAIASRRHEGTREKDDFYRTPTACTEALIRAEPSMPHHVWEPACGDGAISSVLESAGYQVHSTDLVDRGYGEPRRDFLMEFSTPPGVAGIVTNPPFKLANDFACHALGTLKVPYLAMLLRTAFLEGMDRHARLFSPFPPARVWVFIRRPTLWRADEIPDGSGSISYSWFIWDAPHSGAPRLGWL